MRRRDRYVALVLGGMLCLNVLTAVASVSAVYVYRARFRHLSESALNSVRASEKASVEASASAMLLVDLVKDSRVDLSADDDLSYSPPRIVGYGQTRSKNAIYVYRDVEQGGVVHREFIQRIPIR